jgi:soluble lytic murein transglycosylase-like protein
MIESGWKEKAISNKGAIGLMQVMLSTAKWFGLPHKKDELMYPGLNIKIGCAILKRL